MHLLGEIYVEYPRSSLSHSHPARATKARTGRSGEAMDMFDYMGGSLSPSRSRSIGRATNVSDRYFQPTSPGQDVHHRHPNHVSLEHHDRANGATFRAYPLHGEHISVDVVPSSIQAGEARDLEDRITHWELASNNSASQSLPIAPSSVPLDPQENNVLQSEVTSGSSLFGRPELRRTSSRVGHAEVAFPGIVSQVVERSCREPETASAVKHGMVIPVDTSSSSRLYECPVEKNSRRDDCSTSLCVEQPHGYPSRFSEGRCVSHEDGTQGSLPGTPATFSRIVAIGDEDSSAAYSSDSRILMRQGHHQQQESQQLRHYDQGIDLLPAPMGNGTEAALDWSAQGVASRSSTPQMRPEGVPRHSPYEQQHGPHLQHHLQYHHQMQHHPQQQQEGRLSRQRMQAAACGSRDESPMMCDERSNSSGRCPPETWALPLNPPPRAGAHQRPSATYVYPNGVERSARSPSPNTLYGLEGPSRSSSRKSPNSLVHARSLSDGPRDSSWARLSPSASGQAGSGRSSQRVKVPHSRGHSDVVLNGRWQGPFESGGSGVAGDGYVATVRAGSPVLPPTDMTLTRSIVSTPSRGYSVTRHSHASSRSSQPIERGSGTGCNPASGGYNGGISGRDEQHQIQQQHKQRRRLVGMPDDSGFSRLNGRASAGHCSGSSGLNSMPSLAATAGGRIVSPDITRNGSLDIETMSGARRQVTAQRGLGSGGLLGREVGPQICSSPLVTPSQPGTPPIPPPAPKNPTEWLQRLERTRTIKEAAPTTPTTSRSSSMSSLASPAHTAAFGASLVESRDGLRSVTSALDVTGSGMLLSLGRSSLAGTCPAPDCPSTGNCLPGASPDMVVYEVRFKRATRTFLPGDLMGDSSVISCGDRVKVEADRGEDLGTVHRTLALSEYLQALYEEKQAKAAKIAENGGGGGGGGNEGEGGKKKRSKSKKNEDDASKNGSSKSAKQQQQKRPEETQEDICPVRAIKRILRAATEKELEQLAEKTQEEAQILRVCQTKVRNRSLPMKIVDAEYQFDRHKLTLFFEAERRIDFRELVRDLFAVYKTRIWMQQVKDKDVQAAKASAAAAAAVAVAVAVTPVSENEDKEAGKHLLCEVASSGGESAASGTGGPMPCSGAVGPNPSSNSASGTAPVISTHDADHDSGYGSSGSSSSSGGGSTAGSVANSEGRASGSLAANGSEDAFDPTRSYVSSVSGEGGVGGLDSPGCYGRAEGDGSSVGARSASGTQGGFPNQWLVNMTTEPEEAVGNGFDGDVRTCLQSLAMLDLTT